MQLLPLTIDFETYYDKTYSLSKLTTEEYIRSPLFETIGVAVQVGELSSVWCSGSHQEIKNFLAGYDINNSVCIAHNAMFDMAILNWHYDMRPKRIIDTLSMARAIHGVNVGGSLAMLAKHYGLGVKGGEVIDAMGKRKKDFTPADLAAYGDYCKNDVVLTRGLFDALAVDFPLMELKLIDLTIRMFTEPELLLDREALCNQLKITRENKAKLMAAIEADKDSIMSNPKFADLLRSMGVTPPVKISPTTKRETYAFAKTDDGFKDLLNHDDPRIQALAAARVGVKSTLEETRLERFIDISKRGELPVPLKYYAAHTGRWGGADSINTQNLPRKSPIKKAILAPEGYEIVDADSSQIEARTLAWLAGQDDLVEAFENNNAEIAAGIPKSEHKHDPYKIMARKIYGIADNDAVDDGQRFVGKSAILGCGYSIAAPKFHAQLKTFNVDLPLSECEHIIRTYRTTYDRIPELWKEATKAIAAMIADDYFEFGCGGFIKVEGRKGIRLPNGLYLTYTDIREEEIDGKSQFVYTSRLGKTYITKKIYGAKIVENISQGLARIIIGEQMLKIAKKYRVIMTVHDSVVALALKTEVAEAVKYIEFCMRTRPEWCPGLPLNCEVKTGVSYGG